MAVDWNTEVLDQVRTHWDDQLRPRLEGLTDEEFSWEPAPGVTTIAWRLGHLVEGLESTNGVYFGGPRVDMDTFEPPGTAAAALARLDEAYAAWVAGVRSLGEDGLAEPQGDRSPPAFAHAPVVRVVLYTSVEVFHHGAEVCLLRDLWLGLDESGLTR
jgi:hypothetical protein